MTAQIVYLPRLDLPTRAGWYIDPTRKSGLGGIYVLTEAGAWVVGGREVARKDVPAGLKRLGVVS